MTDRIITLNRKTNFFSNRRHLAIKLNKIEFQSNCNRFKK
jgi:hypothetical protein